MWGSLRTHERQDEHRAGKTQQGDGQPAASSRQLPRQTRPHRGRKKPIHCGPLAPVQPEQDEDHPRDGPQGMCPLRIGKMNLRHRPCQPRRKSPGALVRSARVSRPRRNRRPQVSPTFAGQETPRPTSDVFATSRHPPEHRPAHDGGQPHQSQSCKHKTGVVLVVLQIPHFTDFRSFQAIRSPSRSSPRSLHRWLDSTVLPSCPRCYVMSPHRSRHERGSGCVGP